MVSHQPVVKIRARTPAPLQFQAKQRRGDTPRRFRRFSYCPSAVRGQHWYLYMIMDIYSRKIVAWEIHDAEPGELAQRLVERALL